MRYEPIVKITWPLYWMAIYLSRLHNEKESKFGAMTYGEKRGGEEAHLIGLIAEVAISHYFNSPINVDKYEKGDSGTDTVINGKKISIKSTTYWDNPLLRVEIEHFKDDCYYFCTAVDTSGKRVKLVGWVDAETIKKAKVKTFVTGGPKNFVLEPDSLREFCKKIYNIP